MENKKQSSYEEAKKKIQSRGGGSYSRLQMDPEDDYFLEETYADFEPSEKVDLNGLTKVGIGVIIGGGVGLLSGVAAIAVTASVAEIVLGGVVTKIAGAVGGATGLLFGLNSMEKRKRTKAEGRLGNE